MKRVLIACMVLLVSGCSGLREYVAPDEPKGSENIDLTFYDDERYQAIEPISDWWHEFDDPILARLVDQSLESNFDIRVAIANLNQARAIAREAGFDRYPTVTSSAAFERQLATQETGGAGFTPARTRNRYDIGLDAFWEIDLLGRVSEAIDAQRALKDATQADLHQVYVTVTAEVARTYIALRGAQYRLQIAKRNEKNQNDTFLLTQKLMNGGRGTILDTSRAQTQVELTRATIPEFEAQVMAAINRLAVLTGLVPDNLVSDLADVKPLPNLPLSVDVGGVDGLLRRRPDIRSAERVLAARVAQYNIEVTELFPTVDLIGVLGFVTPNFGDIASTALQGNIGPVINWRAFDLGRVRADIDAADAVSQAALSAYEQTVLLALEETQTALSDFKREEERRQILHTATRSAQKAARIARQRYNQGVDNFLDVLDAEATLLQAEDALAQSETNAALDLVSIYKALGGGWQVTEKIE